LAKQTGRTLIWVPIVHTQADFGSMSHSVKKRFLRQRGTVAWYRHVKAVDKMWKTIRHDIDRLRLPYERVRLYQDGLPVCGHETQIVKELAHAGSQNHQILADLMEKGAQITGTESPDLLLEEYELAQKAFAASDGVRTSLQAQRRQTVTQQLLERRDCYIAQRIDATLRAETGMIFLGVLHSLDGRLPSDIDMTKLFGDGIPQTRPKGRG